MEVQCWKSAAEWQRIQDPRHIRVGYQCTLTKAALALGILGRQEMALALTAAKDLS